MTRSTVIRDGVGRSFKIDGVECTECGSIRTRSRRAGFDMKGNRIRVRQCDDCQHRFNTVEAPADFVFNQMDASRIEKDHARNARRNGEGHVAKRFVPRRGTGFLMVSVRAIVPETKNVCRRGLHELTDDNVYVNPSSQQRKCRACAKANREEYYRKYGAAMAEHKRKERERLREEAA